MTLKRSPMKPGSGFKSAAHARIERKKVSAVKKLRTPMKSKQRAVTADEKAYWSRLASNVGCVACMRDGNFNPHVSIHHIDGRTKPGCHMRVLPLCAGHHQDGTGEDKSMVAVHPWKAKFEALYGPQDELQARCNMRLGLNDGSLHVMGAAA